jgi:predicted nuclease of predicted toxin-antitoxin system
MKLLLDANISWKLINILTPIFGECAHVDHIGFTVPIGDSEIWDYAQINGYTIITKDNDFLDLLEIKGFPPKVILLKTGNNSSKALSQLLINAKQDIEEMENCEYGLLEIYGPLKIIKDP